MLAWGISLEIIREGDGREGGNVDVEVTHAAAA